MSSIADAAPRRHAYRFYQTTVGKKAIMAVTGMHHFNVRVSEAEITALQSFYCEILGFRVGPRPPLQRSLYFDGSARGRRNTDFLSRPERERGRAHLSDG